MEEAHADSRPPDAPAEKRGGERRSVVGTPLAFRPKSDDASDDASDSGSNSDSDSDSDSNSDSDISHEEDADEEQLRFAPCPMDGCLESVLASEMDQHLAIHAALLENGQPLPGETAVPLAGSSRPTSSRRPHRGDATASAHQRSDSRSTATEGRSDPHRERRERRRSGLPSTQQQQQQQKQQQEQTMRKSLLWKLATPLPRPWWTGWTTGTTAPNKKSAVVEDKGKTKAQAKEKEVAGPVKGTPTSKQPKRLGKAELGKYADEARMPDKLAVYLKKEFGITHRGIIPVLQQLLEHSPTTEYAYLCDPCVQHVSRLPQEGSFCGYRNLQTVISYIIGARYPGHEAFDDELPSVFDLQNSIEEAWDRGINARGRIETGGIRWTRKYIGTPEAVTLFCSLGIPHSVRAFKHAQPERARDLLLRDVEQYFQMGHYQPQHKVRMTTLPPIYLQHPGHSLTIVGVQKQTNGVTNLLVFDPVFRDGSRVVRVVGRRRLVDYFPDKLLRPYRKGPRYLSRFRAFEILKLRPKPEDLAPGQSGR